MNAQISCERRSVYRIALAFTFMVLTAPIQAELAITGATATVSGSVSGGAGAFGATVTASLGEWHDYGDIRTRSGGAVYTNAFNTITGFGPSALASLSLGSVDADDQYNADLASIQQMIARFDPQDASVFGPWEFPSDVRYLLGTMALAPQQAAEQGGAVNSSAEVTFTFSTDFSAGEVWLEAVSPSGFSQYIPLLNSVSPGTHTVSWSKSWSGNVDASGDVGGWVYMRSIDGTPAVGDGNAIIPEPSTYALALMGITCGGFSLFRCRRRA